MENTNKNVEELFNPTLSQVYKDKFQELIFRMDNAYANYYKFYCYFSKTFFVICNSVYV